MADSEMNFDGIENNSLEIVPYHFLLHLEKGRVHARYLVKDRHNTEILMNIQNTIMLTM